MLLTGNRCKCPHCGEFFNSLSTFDRHRAGNWENRGANRHCLRPEQLTAKGWSKNEAGFWVERRHDGVERVRQYRMRLH